MFITAEAMNSQQKAICKATEVPVAACVLLLQFGLSPTGRGSKVGELLAALDPPLAPPRQLGINAPGYHVALGRMLLT